MNKKIFCKKNLIIIVMVALCIIMTCTAVSSFAIYSHEAKGEGTATPRGDYIGNGNSFEFINKNIDQTVIYNFYLTNVDSDNTVYGKSSTVEFTIAFEKVLSDAMTGMQVKMNNNGQWYELDYINNGQSATFKDRIGFSASKAEINYYQITFSLRYALSQKDEKAFFNITYTLADKINSNIDESVNKQVKLTGFTIRSHQVYLGKVKDVLVNPKDFSIKSADIPNNVLIINVYYYGTICNTIDVVTEVKEDELGNTISTVSLAYAGSGYVPLPNSLTEGYTIVVYRAASLPSDVTLFA